MNKTLKCCSLLAVALLLLLNVSTTISAKETCAIHQATLMEHKEEAPEISNNELKELLAGQNAAVFDARPFKEYAVSHIPGALNLSAKPGVEKAVYVSDAAEVGRVVMGNTSALIVLYCNGMY